MTSFQIDIQLTAIVTAIACSTLGGFLVLRRMAMLTDAISHTVLLGIVIGFFVVQDLASPLLIFGAAAVGVLTVSLVALLERSRLVKGDTAIGLVYPVLFSIAVLLISRFAGDVHLDTDAVLVGELAFIPFDRLYVLGYDIGPRGFFLMGGILLINLAFIVIFYKELKLSTFDAGLATALGFMPLLIHYVLMSLVSITVVSAFDIVGSVLVVALVVVPPATAYLLTDRLPRMLVFERVTGCTKRRCGLLGCALPRCFYRRVDCYNVWDSLRPGLPACSRKRSASSCQAPLQSKVGLCPDYASNAPAQSRGVTRGLSGKPRCPFARAYALG